ncbi:MAG: hypothetical protein MUF68_07360, partial [Cyclobacteriaceae bacterium]|nr:hypothetical protein [Cyclobacteriaceae bacterium]
MKCTISCLFIFLTVMGAQAQLSPEKAAWNNLDKERWQKVRYYLNKALKKDTTNVAANFTYSWYFFTQGNPQLHIDSAQAFLQKVKRDYPRTSKAEKQRLEWFPVNQKEIDRLQYYLDSAAFDRALHANTEQAYAYFAQQHPWALQVVRAKELQIEVGFLMALRRNTYEAFQEFLTKYPTGYRAQEAKERYNKLLYETLTRDQTLQAFQHFFNTYPESPYQQEAERAILILSTIRGDSLAFVKYLQQWPNGRFYALAKSILQHINADEETADVKLPMWGKQNYYLLDANGKEWNLPDASSLGNNKNCEVKSAFFFQADDKVYTNSGVYLTNQFKELHQQPAGFCVVERNLVNEVWHVSAQKIFETTGNVQLLGAKWWLEKKNGESTLYSLLGKKLCSGWWRKVVAFTGWLAFQHETGWIIVPEEKITVDEDPFKYGLLADEMRQFKQGLWYRAGNEEGLLSASGEHTIAKQKIKIEIVSGGIIVKHDTSSTIFGNKNWKEQHVTDAKWIKPFWIGKTKKNYTLLSLQDDKPIFRLTALDTVYCVGQLAVATKKDTVLFITENNLFSISKKLITHTIRKGDSLFIIATKNQKQIIYSAKGQALFVLQDETPEYLGG